MTQGYERLPVHLGIPHFKQLTLCLGSQLETINHD
jgi:hypothetical protein